MFGEDAFNMAGLTQARASSIWNTGGFIAAYAIDGNQETSWRPSRGSPDGEWLEVIFGQEIETGHIEISAAESMEYSFRPGWVPVNEDQSFSFRLYVQNGLEWIDPGSWEGDRINKSVFFQPQHISGIRIVIESGLTDKVSIPEILVFDREGNKIDINPKKFSFNGNDKGGKAYFIPTPNKEIIRTVLNDAFKVWDVRIDYEDKLSDGNLTCIHKKMDGKDIYFFANSSENELEIPILLRGKMKLDKWDPHSGSIEKYPSTTIHQKGYDLTSLQFKLGPVKSLFFVAESLNN